MKYLIFVSLVIPIILSSCKKDTPVEVVEPQDNPSNIAPCEVDEFTYHSSTFNIGGSSFFPDAASHISFYDSLGDEMFQFAFNFLENPSTGMYNICNRDLPVDSIILDNQIMFVFNFGSFKNMSTYSEDSGSASGFVAPEVYVECNEEEILVSFCSFHDNSAYFDQTLNIYIGNTPDSLSFKHSF